MSREYLRELVAHECLSEAIKVLACRVYFDYQQAGVGEVVLIGLLTGAFDFVSRFGRELEDYNSSTESRNRIDFLVDFLDVASYLGDDQSMEMVSSGEVKIYRDLKTRISGRHVLICDDIADTLVTLDRIVAYVCLKNPKSVKVACMLQKEGCGRASVRLDYVALTVSPVYVVGSGLDSLGRYRFLPGIWEVVKG